MLDVMEIDIDRPEKIVYVVGLGPGEPFYMTQQAANTLESVDAICGYKVYLDLIRDEFPCEEYYATGMTQELDRCRWALEKARTGKRVALVCSGDAGVYGMASPLLELAPDYPDVAVEIVPGLTAALSGGAVLGAPLAHDFCVISLSDRLTPWEVQSLLQGQAGLSGKGGVHPAGKRQKCRYRLRHRAQHRPGGSDRPNPDPCPAERHCGGYVYHRVHRQRRHKAAGRQNGHPTGVPQMKAVVFSGTTEGRVFSRQLAALGAEVLVSVATPLGAEEQGKADGITVHCGRLTPEEMAALLQGAALCVDATHPYAVDATKNIRAACAVVGVEYHRLLREESPLPAESMVFATAAHAAAFLAGCSGNVLLATGAKELAAFAALSPERLFPRVLPTREGIAACEAAGIPHKNIIAMQGPFSYALNCALIEQFSIRYLVTKDGGAVGGFAEKAQAAQDTGAQLIVVRRPAENGQTAAQILARCKEVLV